MSDGSDRPALKPEAKVAFAKLAAVFAVAALQAWFVPSPTSSKTKTEPDTAAAKDRGDKFGRFVKVFATMLLIVLACALAAFIFMQQVFRSASDAAVPYIQAGTAGLTLLALITATKEVLLIFKNLVDYIRNGTGADLVAEFVKFSATSLSIFASIFACTMSPLREAAAVLTLPSQLTRPSVLVPSSARAEYYPFLFGLADGPPQWAKGVNLNEQQVRDVDTLTDSLLACVGNQRGQDVVIQVVGYADTNEFRGRHKAGESSVELNLEAANRRAENLTLAVENELNRVKHLDLATTGESKLRILRPQLWSMENPEKMRQSPRYLNVKPLADTGGRDQGLFDRRAEVAVLNTGVCEPLTARLPN